MLASAGFDGKVRLWDPATGQLLDEPLHSPEDRVDSVAWQPDGVVLALALTSEDGMVLLLDTTTGKPSAEPLRGHEADEDDRIWVTSVAWRSDGLALASAGGDGTVRLWDGATGQELGGPLRGHEIDQYGPTSVNSVAWRPDGAVLASAGGDGTVRLWDVSPVSWQARACRVVGRNFSQAEWQRFVDPDTPYQCTCPGLPPGIGAPQDACEQSLLADEQS
jgi:WD40 repeat protein